MRMKVNKLSTNTLTLICGLTGFIVLWVGLRVRENGPGTEVTYYTEMLLLVLGFYLGMDGSCMGGSKRCTPVYSGKR
jgi:hypothetical protein